MTLKRSAAPQRKTRVKPRNAKRKAKEFDRAYGSEARVEWVKRQRCVACGLEGYSENAHVSGGGVGRKADAAKIIPLCIWCHRRQHEMGAGTFAIRFSLDLRALAAETERAWRDYERNRIPF